jgi:L,D-transpeptidase ErfK/SrfK
MSFVASIAVLLIQLAGSEFVYTVQPGDSLISVGARFGVDVRVLAGENGIAPSNLLRVGQPLRVDNRHIVPESGPAGEARIIVNLPQRMLFLFSSGQLVRAVPIAAGKPSWKTPLGDFTVVMKERDPIWDVPASIQQEMRREGKRVLTRVPPGPQNPLGRYWIGLSLPGIGIHGTNAPSSIYSHATHGCMRLHPDDIESLFPDVAIGMRGHIAYEPVLIAREGESVFLEVHSDIYRKAIDASKTALDGARTGGFLELVDLARLKEVILKREGIARDVTRR